MKKSDQSENQITLPQLLLTIVLAVVVLNGIILAPYMALPFSLPIRIAIAVAVIIVVKITNITFLDLLRIYIFPIGLYVYGCFQLYRSPISLVTVEFTVGLLSFVIFLWLDRKYKRVIKLVDEDAEATEDEEEEDEDAADAEVVYEADAEEDWDEDDEEEPEADNVRALESGDEGEAWEEEQAYRFRTEEAKAFFLEWAQWISSEPKQTGTGGNAGGDPDYGTYHGFHLNSRKKRYEIQ